MKTIELTNDQVRAVLVALELAENTIGERVEHALRVSGYGPRYTFLCDRANATWDARRCIERQLTPGWTEVEA